MRRREFIRFIGGAQRLGRLRGARSRADGSGVWGSSWDWPRMMRRRKIELRRSRKVCSNWAGPPAETCKSTIGGAEEIPISRGDTRLNWLHLSRMSSWPLGARSSGHCCRLPALCP